jgi:hypothetical protein
MVKLVLVEVVVVRKVIIVLCRRKIEQYSQTCALKSSESRSNRTIWSKGDR